MHGGPMIPALLLNPIAQIASGAAAFVLVVGSVYLKGKQDGREELLNKQLAQAYVVVGKRAQATEQVRVEYRDRIQVVKERGGEIVREVEKLVPVGVCTLDARFRVLHDAAAVGRLPRATAGVDGAGEAVDQAAAARTVAENYGICHENAEQLTALQGWIKAQQKINN